LKVITPFVAGQDVFASFQPAMGKPAMHAYHYSSIISNISWKPTDQYIEIIAMPLTAITEDIIQQIQQYIASVSLCGLDCVNRKATAVISLRDERAAVMTPPLPHSSLVWPSGYARLMRVEDKIHFQLPRVRK